MKKAIRPINFTYSFFTCEKYNQPASRIEPPSQSEQSKQMARKLASRLFIFKMSERFVDVGSVDNFIAEQENKATLQKTQRDVKLLQTFLGTRNELRKLEEILALELNEYICEFIISVSMNVLLFIASFEISFLPFAEILKRNC